ncbi:MAG TPA: cold shock and DUF1294 domain-containing protein [Pyrinomonadaceae bacterium]|nr:cold shock and DUF1294 domain-containing protein [Pyrinomonadaceae bacterium]
MRFKGKLTSWNDDRGYGFIEPIQGGQAVFVHITAFDPRGGRPQVDDLLWFEVEPGLRGKSRAKNVEYVRRPVAQDKIQDESEAPPGIGSLAAVPGFVLLYVVVGILWEPPIIIAIFYIGASAITFQTHRNDKTAAQQGGWRTSENTLHMLAFAGGWPGALLAQQVLRHKSVKREFQGVFWFTVVLNVAGFILFCSPMAQRLLAVFLKEIG